MTDHQFPPLLSSSTSSESALNFLISQYKRCRDEHIGCRLQPSPTTKYPSRLIDVGEKCGKFVYLRDTTCHTSRGPYVCLSHCWGEKQPLRLTEETELTLQNGVAVAALPLTFENAIFVTRIIGIRFLWIDSLFV